MLTLLCKQLFIIPVNLSPQKYLFPSGFVYGYAIAYVADEPLPVLIGLLCVSKWPLDNIVVSECVIGMATLYWLGLGVRFLVGRCVCGVGLNVGRGVRGTCFGVGRGVPRDAHGVSAKHLFSFVQKLHVGSGPSQISLRLDVCHTRIARIAQSRNSRLA